MKYQLTDIENVKKQVIELTGCEEEEILLASAKSGDGIEDILDTIIENVPYPIQSENNELKALIFDSIFDKYRGVVAYVRVYEGSIKPHENQIFCT